MDYILTKHKNVLRWTKRCIATISGGNQCKNMAEYLEKDKYYCGLHYGLLVGHRYGEKTNWD